ncbi:hypothetical protein FoTM2_013615, partial [Fusarium oxysporum f. sp. vasinfectum]
MRFQFAAISFVFLHGVMADKHDYCACQQWTNGPVDHAATARVAKNTCSGYVWGPYELDATSGTMWNKHSPGPRFDGTYLQNMIKGWKIDGDTFHQQCIDQKAKD